ncbi:FH2 domain-containing protein 1-like [Salvelinus fontinalis]|uniref:FH2 domain-containing protein 1-like n=1 Tax=Salvelinus fontinalis TaxID=8038 RepID=UPI002486814C|nr:FH2 domain-containing protein 1-like [Salvelinus fontinalis]
MHVMSSPSLTNETENCSSEGSISAATTARTTSTTSGLSPMLGNIPSASTLPSPFPNEPPLHPTTLPHHYTPPPPLPPNTPPPPPPPPTSLSSHGVWKKRQVRSFFWKPIPEEKVRGQPNIWTMAVRCQQQYQIDVRSVEELFGQQEEVQGRGCMPATSGSSSARITRSRSFKENKDKISILDSKRGMNVGIFLRQFKRSNHSIVEDIRQGDGKLYGAELLKDLLKLLPESEEVKKLRAFKGDSSKLTLADSFMYLMIQVPRFELRIEAMVLREEFFQSCAVMSHEIDVIRVATKELMTCEELHAILHLVLQAGNIMNAGGYAGNAVGFKLSSLLSLADTKANKPGMNLLHFVALEAQKKDEKLLKFPEKLQGIQSASRISVENIELEFSSLYVRTRSLEEKVQSDPELLEQLDPFLQSSTRTLQDLKRCRLDLRKEGNALIDFFCEDKDTFMLDECFRIFQDFCLKFKKAVKDNLEQERKEAARQRRLRELEKKRSAWNADQQQAAGAGNGGFGRSSSENDVDMLTKEGLLDFLQQRPHIPLGRSASARRHRHTVAAMADRELHDYLELFGSGTTLPADYANKFNSLPRSGRTLHRRTAPWLVSQDDNHKLENGQQVLATSHRAETEPISPLAMYSSMGFNANEELYNNNNNYTTVSEGSYLPRSCQNRNVFQKTPNPGASVTAHMNVSVERHTLVPGIQQFDLPSPNNNTNHMQFVDHKDVVVTDLEMEKESPKALVLDTPPPCPKSLEVAWEGKIPSSQFVVGSLQKEEEEDSSTVSSTTCDMPLPLDPSVSNKKPVFYILDCTETDCSVALDYSEIESSPLMREGLVPDVKNTDCKNIQGNLRDPSSLSSNSHFDSTSKNDQSVFAPTNELSVSTDERAPSVGSLVTSEEGDTDSWDTAEARQVGEKAVQTYSPKPTHAKTKKVSKVSKNSKVGRGVRMLTTTENQDMRKVVPITKLSRTGSNVRRVERPVGGHEGARQPLIDKSTPARERGEKTGRPARHSSLPPEETKSQGNAGLSGWARDLNPRKPSFRKPSTKPLRNLPKPPPEEKMCRSTMRALAAQAQGQVRTPSEASATHSSKTPSATLPGWARNTVASSSRTTKKELAPTLSNPPTPSRSPSLLSRSSSQSQAPARPPAAATTTSPAKGGQHSPQREEKEKAQGGGLQRVQSVRASSRASTQRSDTPPSPPTRERSRKSSSFSEKSVQSTTSCRTIKPTWK